MLLGTLMVLWADSMRTTRKQRDKFIVFYSSRAKCLELIFATRFSWERKGFRDVFKNPIDHSSGSTWDGMGWHLTGLYMGGYQEPKQMADAHLS